MRLIHDAILIDSTLVSVAEGYENNYYPDSFTVRMHSEDVMRGVLRSIGPTDPVQFIRVKELVS